MSNSLSKPHSGREIEMGLLQTLREELKAMQEVHRLHEEGVARMPWSEEEQRLLHNNQGQMDYCLRVIEMLEKAA